MMAVHEEPNGGEHGRAVADRVPFFGRSWIGWASQRAAAWRLALLVLGLPSEPACSSCGRCVDDLV